MSKSLDNLYCASCGSSRIFAKAWVDPNTRKFDSFCPYPEGPIGAEDVYCENCECDSGLKTLKELWDIFSDIPINNDDEIEEQFLGFEPGVSRFDVWHWFDERCPNGLAVDLMGVQPKK